MIAEIIVNDDVITFPHFNVIIILLLLDFVSSTLTYKLF